MKAPRGRRYVSVDFGGGEHFCYLNHIEGLETGDLVVVETPKGGMRVVEVVTTKPGYASCKKAWKWVVDKVDTTKYQALMALACPPPEDSND